MCSPDPNAGARRAAKAEHNARVAKYGSDSIKRWNSETSYSIGKNTNIRGYSRDTSDAYQKAINILASGRVSQQSDYINYATSKAAALSGQAGRSRTAGKAAFQNILRNAGAIENSISNAFGRNYDTRIVGATRTYQTADAKNLASLKAKPEFGAPVMMPPRDRAGQFLNNLQTGLSIGTSLTGLGAFKSTGFLGNTNILKGTLE